MSRSLFYLVLFAPSVNALHNQFVHGVEVAALDSFLHQSPGFRFEFYRHTFNLVTSKERRKLFVIS